MLRCASRILLQCLQWHTKLWSKFYLHKSRMWKVLYENTLHIFCRRQGRYLWRYQLSRVSGQIFCYVTAPKANIVYLPSYWRNSSQLNYELPLRLSSSLHKRLKCEKQYCIPRLTESVYWDLWKYENFDFKIFILESFVEDNDTYALSSAGDRLNLRLSFTMGDGISSNDQRYNFLFYRLWWMPTVARVRLYREYLIIFVLIS